MWDRIIAISKKEIRQLSRDKRMLYLLFIFPALLLVIFGYAVNFDVKDIKLAVYDQENSDYSRKFVNSLLSSGYFTHTGAVSDEGEIKGILDRKDAQAVLVIPQDFSQKALQKGGQAKIQFLVDGVDGNTASIMSNYMQSAARLYNQSFQTEILSRYGTVITPPVLLEPMFWFNPALESSKYLVPGLIGMILIITAVISVSLSLVREKEKGTIEQINVSSLSTLELLLGKAFPYIIISFIDAIIVLLMGYILFGVEVKGRLFLLFGMTFSFIIASISIGIFVSVIADTQQVAFMMATFVSMLPSMILSGFIFPIESMPVIVQIFTNITPAKFYIVILRAIILKGVGFSAFWDQFIYLSLFAVFFLGLASIINNKKLKSA
ncbi:MAG TPA: ABC transporter permease [Ignavibacteriales bacterium]|nr:ABC transporter permease [Ignavibacteriales bacterium]